MCARQHRTCLIYALNMKPDLSTMCVYACGRAYSYSRVAKLSTAYHTYTDST